MTLPDNVVVLPLPAQREASCFICVHALVSDRTFCTLYQEFVLTESATAADCEDYQEDEGKT